MTSIKRGVAARRRGELNRGSVGHRLSPAWLAPQDLSAAGQHAYDPQVAVDGQGNAIAVWQRSDGTNTIVQAAARAAGGVRRAAGPLHRRPDRVRPAGGG